MYNSSFQLENDITSWSSSFIHGAPQVEEVNRQSLQTNINLVLLTSSIHVSRKRMIN